MFNIRAATASDAMGIAIVQAYTWATTYQELLPEEIINARIERVFSQGEYLKEQILAGKRYLVAECMGSVVGFAAFGPSRNELYSDDGEIYGLYVLKGFQGKGVGKQLLEHCSESFCQDDYTSMILNCLQGNKSLGFYHRMGGHIVGTREDVIHGGSIIREDILRFNIRRK